MPHLAGQLLIAAVLVCGGLLCCVHRITGLSDARATCRSVPGLTREQLELCYRASDVTTAALDGLELAVRECQFQFQWHRWNCSSLSTKSRNPHSSSLLKRGYRESAFAYAISAAGVVHSVARACSQGRLISCGCDPSINRRALSKSLRDSLQKASRAVVEHVDTTHNNIYTATKDDNRSPRMRAANRWKWGGCSHNMDFGEEFAEMFLDAREKAGDIQSKINLHNNRAGRMAVSNNMQIKCKCHGMSGSCQLKTCWKSAPDFRVVGKVLKQQFRRAILVDQSNMGNGPPLVVLQKPHRRKSSQSRNNVRPPRRTPKSMANDLLIRPNNNNFISANGGGSLNGRRENRRMELSLFYYQRSPNFCEKDPQSDIQGTVGRRCNRTSAGGDGCASMCCGRGYNLVREKRIDRCHCKFHWCCYVECQDCEVEEWISVCN